MNTPGGGGRQPSAADLEGERKGIAYDGNLTPEDGIGQWWEGLDPRLLYGINLREYEGVVEAANSPWSPPGEGILNRSSSLHEMVRDAVGLADDGCCRPSIILILFIQMARCNSRFAAMEPAWGSRLMRCNGDRLLLQPDSSPSGWCGYIQYREVPQ